MTLKVSEPERGPGLWKMNYTVIQAYLFKHIFESFWNKWKLQKNNFKNKLEWWEQTKIKIKSSTIDVHSFSLPFFFSRLKKYFVDFSPFSYQFTFDRILEASAFFIVPFNVSPKLRYFIFIVRDLEFRFSYA
jgi:hypothetical protein